MNKNLKKRTALLGCGLLLMLLLSACAGGDKLAILRRLQTFQKCCQEQDAEGIIACLEPEKAAMINDGLAMVEKFTGISEETVFGLVFRLLAGDKAETEEVDYSMEFTVRLKDLVLNKEKTNADVTIELRFAADNTEVVQKATVRMVKEKEEWYISGISFTS